MKYIYYILLLCLTISCQINRSTDNLGVSIKASVVRSFDTAGFVDMEKNKGYDIKLSMVNKSSKPISFWIMSCSWQDNFIINNDYINFLVRPCDHNFPHIKTLKPNDSVVFNSSVVKFDFTIGQCVESTRFGFIYIDSNNQSNFREFSNIIFDKSKHDKIIWSNPVFLNGRE